MALIPKVKLPRVALQRSTLQTPNTPKFVKPKDGKIYIRMPGVFLTLLDKCGRPQPDKPFPQFSIDSQPASTGRPLVTMALPWQLVLKRSGEPKPAKSARKDTSTPFKRTLPCCFTSPLAVYAKTFSSSSIRDRFSKSAFRPKDYIIGSAEALPILCVSDFCERERERERDACDVIRYHAEIASDPAYDYLDGAQTQRVDAF